MPGIGSHRFQSKDRTAAVVIVVTVLLFTNLGFSFIADFWIEHFAPRHPIASCVFPIQLKTGMVGFVPMWLVRYQHSSLSVHFAILGILFLLWCWYALKGQVVGG